MCAIARFKHIHRLWRVDIFRRQSWIRRIPYPQSFQWRSRLLPHLILRLLQPRSKIIWSEPHTFTYLLPRAKEPGGTFNVFTKAIYLQNVGKQSASDVQVICNYEPQYYNLLPPLPHETETMDDKRFVIRANSLGPKEWFQIEILSEELLPNVLRVRTSTGGDGKLVAVNPMRIYSKTFRAFVLLLLFLGTFSVIYHISAAIISAISGSGAQA